MPTDDSLGQSPDITVLGDFTGNISKILELPGYRRLFQGHLLDIMEATCNSACLARWAQHFSQVTGFDFSAVPGYADARGAAVRKQLYTLYWRQNLTAGEWQVLATIPPPASTCLQEITDLLTPGASQRFYRLATAY